MTDTPTTTPRKIVTRKQGGLSLTRLTLALFTFGLSIPFVGVRRVKRTTTKAS